MLDIVHPPTYVDERQYIYDVILGEFLGLDYHAQVEDCREVRISLRDDSLDRQLILPDALFQTPESLWLTPSSLPEQPVKWWEVPQPLCEPHSAPYSVPVIYGEPRREEQYYTEDDHGALLGIDVFGSAFFMLTRYEELAKPDRDKHGRFPASSSLAYQEGFLERPVVNEYLEILWNGLRRLWPGLQRRPRTHRVLLSHDVDIPLCATGRNPLWFLGNLAADIVVRRDASLAAQRLAARVKAREGFYDQDPCNTFDFIMDLSEECGLRSAFHFIADQTGPGIVDGTYDLDDAWIRSLIREILERGHQVGLHPSYNSYRDPAQTKKEFGRLQQVVALEGGQQSGWGGRQHYLRWQNPVTWQNWADAGLDYDSTLGFADHVGFRCGVCYEYPVFNLRTRQRLRLRERPLVVMEATLFSHMHLKFEAASQRIAALNAACRRLGGDFSLLWHNQNLISRREQEHYELIIDALTG